MPISRLAPALLCLGLTALPVLADDARDVAELIGQGQAKAALERVDAALAKQPNHPRLRFLRGVALADQQRPAEAIAVFVALSADYPNLPEPHNNLAVLYAQQGQLDKARASLQQAIRTNPAYATAHANLADVYARLAAQAYDRALQLDIAERRNTPPSPSAPAPAVPKLALVKELYTPLPGGSPTLAARTPAPPPTVIASAPTPRPVPAPIPAPTPVPAVKPATPTPAPTVAKPPVAPPPPVAVPVPPPVAVKPVPVPPPVAVKPTPAPVPPAPAPTPKPEDDDKQAEAELARAVNGWADAWADQRVSAYLGYYGKSFKPPKGESRASWESSRRERIVGAKRIEVKVQNLRIKVKGDEAEVRFVQRYRSDRLDSSTGKTLILQKQGDRWLIKEERVG